MPMTYWGDGAPILTSQKTTSGLSYWNDGAPFFVDKSLIGQLTTTATAISASSAPLTVTRDLATTCSAVSATPTPNLWTVYNAWGGDSAGVALWSFEVGDSFQDTIGDNDITAVNSPQNMDNDFREGAGSLYLNGSNQYLYRTNANLSAGFPLKNTDTLKKGTVCCWVMRTADQAGTIWSKGRTISLSVSIIGGLSVYWNGTSYGDLGFPTLTKDEWYHVTVVFDGVNKIFSIILYKLSTSTFYHYVALMPDAITANETDWMVGQSGTYPSLNGGYFKGKIDELLVLNRELCFQEISEVVNQTHSAAWFRSDTNRFAGDNRFKAQFNFEPGFVLDDSLESNTLSASGANYFATSIIKMQGAMGVSNYNYRGNVSEHLSIADADLPSGFPLKNGDTAKTMSMCGWFTPLQPDAGHGAGALKYIFGKGDMNAQTGCGLSTPVLSSWELRFWWNGAFFTTGITLSAMVPYHIGFVVDGVNKTAWVRLYDSSTGVATTYPFSPATTLTPGSGPLIVAGYDDGHSSPARGIYDEIIVSNALLSEEDIDAIRMGDFCPTFLLDTACDAVSDTSSPILIATLNADLLAVSTVTAPVLEIPRIFTTSCLAVSKTKDVHLLLGPREVFTDALAESDTSIPNLLMEYSFPTPCRAVSDTTSPVLGVTRQLTTAALAVSNTPRLLDTTCLAESVTSQPDLGIIRKLATAALTVTATSSPELEVTRRLISALLALSSASAALTVTRPYASVLSAQSATTTPNLLITRFLATLAIANSLTSDTVDLHISDRFVTDATAVSTTTAPDLLVLRELLSIILARSSTTDPSLKITREMASAMLAVSSTPLVHLNFILRTVALAVSSASSPVLQIIRELVTAAPATCSTLEALLQVIRDLVTTILAVDHARDPELKVYPPWMEWILRYNIFLQEVELEGKILCMPLMEDAMIGTDWKEGLFDVALMPDATIETSLEEELQVVNIRQR
jgi:hypothetical protein